MFNARITEGCSGISCKAFEIKAASAAQAYQKCLITKTATSRKEAGRAAGAGAGYMLAVNMEASQDWR